MSAQSDAATLPLRVSNLKKKYRQGATTVTALDDVTLDVSQGEFVAIMGASGSGKSTLLHLMAGLTSPDAGTVAIDGNDLFKMSDYRMTLFRRKNVGLVFQAYNLIPSLSAEDNITLPILLESGNHTDRGELERLLDDLELTARRRHRPDALSGGEQQRVAIARALIQQPSVILADEPTGNLDSVAGRHICEILRRLCDVQQRTIVMVTHEPSVAIWTSRVVILKDGRIIDDFSTEPFETANDLADHYQRSLKGA